MAVSRTVQHNGQQQHGGREDQRGGVFGQFGLGAADETAELERQVTAVALLAGLPSADPDDAYDRGR